ncbi:MAG: enoyl-CoA hydratase [Acidimicrobiia bacterium]|nr:enoyl-CoA hydratase [Acidimicrobiia bacterium]
MPDDVVLYDVADRIATVTLNRPEARNALSRAVRSRLPKLLEQADADDDVDVIILTGADPAFCAGLDLKELGSGEHDVGAAMVDDQRRRGPFPELAKPVIGAINGVAITGGFELALNCDFLVASDRARFADTHSRVGIQPGWGLTVLLPAAVGVRRAKELSATGNFLDAPTALAWGLVNHVVAHEELLPFCLTLAADIASNDQAGVRRILQTYDEGSLVAGEEAWQLEGEVSREWLRSGGGRPEDVEGRRRAVMARGRQQSG